MAWSMLQEEVCGLLHPGPMSQVRAILEYILYKLIEWFFFKANNQPDQSIECFQEKILYFNFYNEPNMREKMDGNWAKNRGKRSMLEI